MKKRIFIKYFLIALCISICSCHADKADIIGKYASDKYESKTGEAIPRTILTIKSDNSFELQMDDSTITTGTWKIATSGYYDGKSGRREPQGMIEFNYEDRQIYGMLQGTIFYFIEPDIFMPERLKSILFVRLKK